MWAVFLFCQFCDVAKVANDPHEYLAKFGYKQNMKLENFKTFFCIFW
jgi:hypothetical protein